MTVDSCDTGYTGNPSVNQITCEASGSWSDISGCIIVSKYFSRDTVSFRITRIVS